LDDDVKAALHDSAVTHYTRAFGSRRDYGGKRLQLYSGFDIDLHEHICDLRNKLIAHHDNETLRGLARHEYIGVNLADESVSRLVGTLGIVKALEGINDRALALRYAEHCHACAACLHEIVTERLEMLHRAAIQFPESAGADTTPTTTEPVRATPSMRVKLPAPLDPRAPGIPEPTFDGIPPGAYKYRNTVYAYRPPTDFEIDTTQGRGHVAIKDN
jgi:hypothetical protein